MRYNCYYKLYVWSYALRIYLSPPQTLLQVFPSLSVFSLCSAQQTLKQELLKRYSEWLDKQFGENTSQDENDVEVSPMGDTFDSVQQ